MTVWNMDFVIIILRIGWMEYTSCLYVVAVVLENITNDTFKLCNLNIYPRVSGEIFYEYIFT